MIAPLHDFASLSAHFAEHDYPPPHPFAQLFPRMTEAEQEALTASIRINEMLDDVTTFNGQIADGNGRCVSAIELGFPWDRVRKTEFDGDEAALLQFVIDKNLSRRHLNESQRAMAAARLANMTQGARTDRPHIAQICAMSQQQAADRLNVSRRTRSRCREDPGARCPGTAGRGGFRHSDGFRRDPGDRTRARQTTRDGRQFASPAKACEGVRFCNPQC